MKIKLVFSVLISIVLFSMKSNSCTIFYVTDGNIIYAGNNEDWKDNYTKMWFYPSEDNKYGWIKFGFGSGFPQGGMNEQGLFWDGTSNSYLAMPISEANKEKYPGPLMQKIIEECATIQEVREIFEEYYCEDQYRAQYLVGDSAYNSIIVEGDNIISMQGNYLLLTNFYHSNPDLGGYPCWRYDTADEMISNNNNLTSYFIGSVLEATHQDGNYPTQYSNIYDLRNCQIYLFHFHNYEEFIKIDLKEELNKGYRSFDIPDLFSKVRLLSPANDENIASSSVTFSWEGLPGNSYEVIYSTDAGFTENNSKCLTYISSDPTNNSSFIYSLFGLLFIIPWIKRKKLIFPSVMILFAVLFIPQCKKNDIPTQEVQVVEMSETVSNLLPGTTYYWKIKAHNKTQDDFYSETLTRYFNTGNPLVGCSVRDTVCVNQFPL